MDSLEADFDALPDVTKAKVNFVLKTLVALLRNRPELPTDDGQLHIEFRRAEVVN
jgi:hypothetical protein